MNDVVTYIIPQLMTQHRHCRPIVRRRGFSACVGVFLKINPTIAEGLAILHRHRVQRCFDLAEAMVGALFDEDWLALATLTRELADLIEALDARERLTPDGILATLELRRSQYNLSAMAAAQRYYLGGRRRKSLLLSDQSSSNARVTYAALFDEDWLALATLTRELADLIEALDARAG